MRKLLTILFLLLPLLSQAQSPAKHLVRLGWGDMFYESLAFPSAGRDLGGHGYTGHLFAEYQYRITRVISVGGQMDFEGIFTPDMDNYDLVLMPTVRFTYLNKATFRRRNRPSGRLRQPGRLRTGPGCGPELHRRGTGRRAPYPRPGPGHDERPACRLPGLSAGRPPAVREP